MISTDFYRILHGWDVENYLTEGVKYCAIFIKLTESLDDNLLVQYINGTKRRVAGQFLFMSQSDVENWLTTKQQAEINDIDNKIYQLNVEKDLVYQKYAGITIEEKVIFQ